MKTKKELLEELLKEAEKSLKYHLNELQKDQVLLEAGFGNDFGVNYENNKIKECQLKIELLKSAKV